MQSRKNFYRRNRDLCIIAMVGVYLAKWPWWMPTWMPRCRISISVPTSAWMYRPVLIGDTRDFRPRRRPCLRHSNLLNAPYHNIR